MLFKSRNCTLLIILCCLSITHTPLKSIDPFSVCAVIVAVGTVVDVAQACGFWSLIGINKDKIEKKLNEADEEIIAPAKKIFKQLDEKQEIRDTRPKKNPEHKTIIDDLVDVVEKINKNQIPEKLEKTIVSVEEGIRVAKILSYIVFVPVFLYYTTKFIILLERLIMKYLHSPHAKELLRYDQKVFKKIIDNGNKKIRFKLFFEEEKHEKNKFPNIFLRLPDSLTGYSKRGRVICIENRKGLLPGQS